MAIMRAIAVRDGGLGARLRLRPNEMAWQHRLKSGKSRPAPVFDTFPIRSLHVTFRFPVFPVLCVLCVT